MTVDKISATAENVIATCVWIDSGRLNLIEPVQSS